MDKPLSAILEQSLNLTGSSFKQMEQLMGNFNLSGQKPAGSIPGAGTLNGLIQLNQLTLSTLELLKHWEKTIDGLNLFLGTVPGWPTAKDNQDRKMEEELAVLRKRLDAQESLIRELQSKLGSKPASDDDDGDAAQILSDFFATQNEQFQKLLKKNG